MDKVVVYLSKNPSQMVALSAKCENCFRKVIKFENFHLADFTSFSFAWDLFKIFSDVENIIETILRADSWLILY